MIGLAKKRIVILGGGFAGMMTAITLQKKLDLEEAEVVLVNENDYQFITYKLHEIASGKLSNEAVSVKISELIDPNYITFIKDRVKSIHKEEKTVHLTSESIRYDILVACLGGEPQTFQIPGVDLHAQFISTRDSSRAIYEKMVANLLAWHEDKDDARCTIACVGAGFTGLEFLGEMIDQKQRIARQCNIPEDKIKILCLEAADRILPAFPKQLTDYTLEYLSNHGVEVTIGQRIASVDESGIILADGTKVASRNVVWATGVTGNNIIHEAGFPEVGRTKRVQIKEFLEVVEWADVYVIGDSSVCFDEEGNPYPQTAQLASQQGEYLGYHLVNQLREIESSPFHFTYRGTVMSIGKVAAGLVYGHNVKGLIGHLFKVLIDHGYFLKANGLLLTMKMFFKK